MDHSHREPVRWMAESTPTWLAQDPETGDEIKQYGKITFVDLAGYAPNLSNPKQCNTFSSSFLLSSLEWSGTKVYEP